MRSAPVERGDLVAHLLEALGHAVAGAGHVADAPALDREVEGDGLQARRRLEQLQGDVVVYGSRPAGVPGRGRRCGPRP